MQTNREYRRVILVLLVNMGAILSNGTADTFARASYNQDRPTQTSLTPVQLEIEKQRTRLSSADIEERRDALARLGSMHNPEASRVALSALRDAEAILR